MGSSSRNTQQQQQSISQPWAPAQPALSSILAQVQGLEQQPSTNANQQAGIQGLQDTSGYLSQFLPQLGTNTSNLLAGGNAQAQAPLINSAYQQYQSQLNPYLQQSFLDPRNTPGFGAALAATNADITNQINGQFAAAGRDLSGMNAQTLARGLSQGEGQLIANQYNQNVGNQLGAAGSLYGAGNTTGGLLSALQQQALANQQAGIGSAQAGQQFATSPAQQLLTAGQLQQQIPLQYLQGLSGITTGIAGLGGQVNSTGQQQQNATQPLAQTIGQLGNFGRLLFAGS
jgi:hypothetical protein